ncbi:MAG: hypothetical protein IKP06_01760 [Elusimicrobiaceae bacterium]|nr:hypothetical protein [Elusimicrobiaceae bacterium]
MPLDTPINLKTRTRRVLNLYGAFSFPSTMLILKQAENRQKMALFSFQSGNKAAKSASFFVLPKR